MMQWKELRDDDVLKIVWASLELEATSDIAWDGLDLFCVGYIRHICFRPLLTLGWSLQNYISNGHRCGILQTRSF
jgi:hypothetical protein